MLGETWDSPTALWQAQPEPQLALSTYTQSSSLVEPFAKCQADRAHCRHCLSIILLCLARLSIFRAMAPVVFITGAGGEGIGLNTAVRFAKAGYTVVASDIAPLDAAVKAVESHGQKCVPLHLDVCKSESVNQGEAKQRWGQDVRAGSKVVASNPSAAVQSAIDQCGQINVLVNNAAKSLGTDMSVQELVQQRHPAAVRD